MNNIYYRATHLIHNDEYGTMRAGLRMNVMANPGVDKMTFELASLAVSAINGCGACLDSHERDAARARRQRAGRAERAEDRRGRACGRGDAGAGARASAWTRPAGRFRRRACNAQ